MNRRDALAAAAACAACAAFPSPARARRALALFEPTGTLGRYRLLFSAHPKLATTGGSVVAAVPGATGDAAEIVVTRTGAASATALSAFCTHEGSVVGAYNSTTQRIVCPNHGAQYDVNGRVVVGPARFPLTPYAASVEPDAIAVEIPGFVAADADARATAARLHAPAPNPSAGPVRLGLALARPARVRLVVADALGREVAVVLDGPCSAGEHTATWDGEVAPGAYVVRLAVDGAVVAAQAVTRTR